MSLQLVPARSFAPPPQRGGGGGGGGTRRGHSSLKHVRLATLRLQLVWRDTTKVGCAVNTACQWAMYVCQYSVQGEARPSHDQHARAAWGLQRGCRSLWSRLLLSVSGVAVGS